MSYIVPVTISDGLLPRYGYRRPEKSLDFDVSPGIKCRVGWMERGNTYFGRVYRTVDDSTIVSAANHPHGYYICSVEVLKERLHPHVDLSDHICDALLDPVLNR